ncbi:MAG: hypothetical protein K2Y29_12875 [Beijerinckiaceae bacterium]|nr:hypothetical protein [Beijerinckiaceae bacterium]
MLRAPGLLAALALCASIIGGAVWLRASLDASFSRGKTFGEALATVEAHARLAQQQVDAERLRRAAERDVAALEAEKDALRESLHDLEKKSAPVGGADAAPACLDAGLVRALDAIRRPAAPGRAP